MQPHPPPTPPHPKHTYVPLACPNRSPVLRTVSPARWASDVQLVAREHSRRVYRNVAWHIPEVNRAERAVAAALLKHRGHVGAAMDAYSLWAVETERLRHTIKAKAAADANHGAGSSLEEKPSHRQGHDADGGDAARAAPPVFAGVNGPGLVTGVLDAFVAARKLRRWLVQVRRDVANSDDRVYEKLAPGIEERARMLLRTRPAVLPHAERGSDPQEVAAAYGVDGVEDGVGGNDVPMALNTTAFASAVVVERECLTFVSSHSLNMIALARHIEWSRLQLRLQLQGLEVRVCVCRVDGGGE
jgi:hypothetical protein